MFQGTFSEHLNVLWINSLNLGGVLWLYRYCFHACINTLLSPFSPAESRSGNGTSWTPPQHQQRTQLLHRLHWPQWWLNILSVKYEEIRAGCRRFAQWLATNAAVLQGQEVLCVSPIIWKTIKSLCDVEKARGTAFSWTAACLATVHEVISDVDKSHCSC